MELSESIDSSDRGRRYASKVPKKDPVEEMRQDIRSMRKTLDGLEAKLGQIRIPSKSPWKQRSKTSWKLSNGVYEQTLKSLGNGLWSFPKIHAAALAQVPPAGFPRDWRTFMQYVQQHRKVMGLKSHREMLRENAV